MQRRLKSLLRKSRKDAQSPYAEAGQDSGSTPHSEQRPHSSHERGHLSKVHPSEASNRGDNSQHASGRQSFQRPLSQGDEPPVAATDYGHPDPEEIDNSVADNYRAYLPVVSPDRVSNNGQFISLGGDSRLRTGASEMKHSEDIADRNIDMYGTSSRHGSLPSQKDTQAFAQNSEANEIDETIRKGSIGNISAGSIGSPGSIDSFPSKSSATKYALGTGIATEGSLIDSILPHTESSEQRKYKRQDWPTRAARDELHMRRKPVRGSDDSVTHGVHSETPQESTEHSRPSEKQRKSKDGLMDLRSAVMDGQQEHESELDDLALRLEGVVDLSNTVDVDKSTRWAPAVTHEVVKPTQHHIREEKIYREIHNHDVYHRIQPVYQTEILPARHFLRDANNNLIEVSEDQLPGCTGNNQRWFLGEKENPPSNGSRSYPRITEPRIVIDETHLASEGFQRRETTIVHPPELEDLSGYKGPVLPIRFVNKIEETKSKRQKD